MPCYELCCYPPDRSRIELLLKAYLHMYNMLVVTEFEPENY